MGKRKIKKNVKKIFYILIVLALFLSIGLYSFIKIYKHHKISDSSIQEYLIPNYRS